MSLVCRVQSTKLFLWSVFLFGLALLFIPLSFASATTVGTNATISGTLSVEGNVTLGNLATADTVTLTGRIAADVDPNANNTIDLGAYDLAYNDVFASGTMYSAVLTVDGNTTLGNLATADTLTITARLAADVDPNANNTIDLGAYDLAYNDVFASGTMYSAVLTVDGNTTLGNLATADTLTITARLAADVDPNANNTIDLGAYDLAYNDVFASGTMYSAVLTVDGNTTLGNATSDTLTVTARLAADLDPNANNTIDLGEFGLAYNDVFASGTMYSLGHTLFDPSASTTMTITSGGTGLGGRIYIEDADGSGCTELYVNNGAVSGTAVTCPST